MTKTNDLDKFTAKFTNKRIESIQIGRRYYLKNKELEEIRDRIDKEPQTIGVYLGEKTNDKNKEFIPSMELLKLLSTVSEDKIFINKKAEWLFLCGRDVFEDSIIKKKAEGLVLVQNENDENLGFGKTKGNSIKNILDRGDFLRRERR